MRITHQEMYHILRDNEENRPCEKCAHKLLIGDRNCGDNDCNFAHSSFKPRKKYEEHPDR